MRCQATTAASAAGPAGKCIPSRTPTGCCTRLPANWSPTPTGTSPATGGMWPTSVNGPRFLLLHGDQVRGYAGIPWYGWARKVLAWGSLSRIWPDMDFDHVVAGHFH